MKAIIASLILEPPSSLVGVVAPDELAVNLTWQNNTDPRSYAEVEIYCDGFLAGIGVKQSDGTMPTSAKVTTYEHAQDGTTPLVNGRTYKFTVQAYNGLWPWTGDSELSNEAVVEV